MAAVRHDRRLPGPDGRRLPLGALLSRATLLLVLASAACGDDVSLSVRFSSGTVSETAQCAGGGGRFPLLQQDGLTVTVLITDDTTIVRADFRPASCGDVVKGEQVSVRGTDDGGRIRADEVELLGS